MARPTLTERFGKWPLRYAAYALAHGATDSPEGIAEFRELFPDKIGYTVWIAAKRETFRLQHDIPVPDLTRDQEREFDRWLEAQFNAPACPGCEHTMSLHPASDGVFVCRTADCREHMVSQSAKDVARLRERLARPVGARRTA